MERRKKIQDGGNHNWKVITYVSQYTYQKKKKCESNDKYKEQQKNKHEDVKKDIKITKEGKESKKI